MENRIWSSSILNNARAQNLANVRVHPHSMANDGHMTVIGLTHAVHMTVICLPHDRQERTNDRLDGDGEGGRSKTCRYHIQHLETCPESETVTKTVRGTESVTVTDSVRGTEAKTLTDSAQNPYRFGTKTLTVLVRGK